MPSPRRSATMKRFNACIHRALRRARGDVFLEPRTGVVMVHRRGSQNVERTFAEALVEESSDALVALTPDGDVVSWSTGARRIFGYTAASVIGRPLIELIVPP